MAAKIVQSMAEFSMGDEDWVEYSERFEMYLLANGVTEGDLKRAVFLSTIGSSAYKLLRSLVGEEVKTMSLADLSKAMKDHLKPAPNVIAERFRFFKRDRQSGESVNAYITELRRLSEHCEFKTELNTYLRDRFVCGLNSETVQQKLLAAKDLTLEKSLSLARSFEATSRDAKMIHGGGTAPGAAVAGVNQADTCSPEEVHRLNQQSTRGRQDTRECYRCGNVGHISVKCPYASYSCHRCGKVGHLEKRCRQEKKEPAKGAVKSAPVRRVCTCQTPSGEGSGGSSWEQSEDYLSMDPLNLYLLGKQSSSDPVMVEVQLNGTPVRMEVDTGAAVTVMSLPCYERVKGEEQQLKKSDLKLKTYTGEIVSPEGVGQLMVKYRDQQFELPVTVVKGSVPNLMGRDWLSRLQLKWDQLFPNVSSACVQKLEGVPTSVANLVEEFPTVFTDELGCLRNFKVRIPVEDGTQPKFYKARPVPYAMRARVEAELDKLEKQGVWKRVQYSNWAAPIVPALKDPRDPSGPIRICGDFKMTVNKCAPLDPYPIPNTVDQLAMLAGGEKFTKLDLSQAYQQLELEESSRELLTINTHQGLYQPARLQFGIHSATGIFQREMDRRLCKIPFTKARVDDILVSGRNDAEHLSNLRQVLVQLKEAGLTLRVSKCQFMRDEVTYCGYVVSRRGVSPMPSNVEAVKEAPAPTCVTELRSFLGMVNYYNMYLPNMATCTEPLHNLLRKGVQWSWSNECDSAFQRIKRMLCEAPLLVLFDMSKPIVVHTDASQYGIGAVLSHVMEDGSEKPVSYASRTLSSAERNYSTVEKEGLALVYAVRKFHQFLFGNRFGMVTDHKPLLGLFAENCPLPDRAAARVLRWALLLSAYDYKLTYREGSKNGNADALSRLPLDAHTGEFSQKLATVAMMELVKSPVTEAEMRRCTRSDPVLSVVLQRILEGGLDREADESFKPYRRRVSELTTECGCVLWGRRVVVPAALRTKVLEELHEVHPGVVRMKALARSYVWWPGIDQEIENAVRCCSTCQVNQSRPAAASAHPWEYPTRPWERLHIDHAGPLDNRTYLIVVDSYSKWPEIERVKSTDAKTTCAALRRLFATHGIPRTVVSDNGSGFVSAEMQQFFTRNGVRHIVSAPYHPSSNGQAERYVRTFKEMLRSLKEGDVDTKLCRLLFRYRLTPQTTTGQSPAELLMNRQLRSALGQMKPDLDERVRDKQRSRPLRMTRRFSVGQEVLVVNFSGGAKWVRGVVTEVLGSTDYSVRLVSGRIVHRHIDQMVAHYANTECPDEFAGPEEVDAGLVQEPEPTPVMTREEVSPMEMEVPPLPPVPATPVADVGSARETEPRRVRFEMPAAAAMERSPVVEQAAPESVPERRPPSGRVSRRPAYLKDYVE